MKLAWVFGTVIVATEMSVLFDFGDDESKWVPKSVIDMDDDADFDVGVSDDWPIAEWWAARNGLL